MEPTSLPDNNEGWVIDDRALYTLFMLRGAKKGDELIAERPSDGRGGHHAYVEDEDYVNDSYANLELSNGRWKVLAWRPRGKQHS